MQISRSFQRSSLFAGMIALGLVVGLASHRFVPAGQPLAMAAWMAVPIAIAIGGSLWWWRALDEVARDAHKIAWFWGGCIGLLVGAMGFVGATTADPDLITRLFPTKDKPAELVALGIDGAAFAQMVGYLLVWCGWWLGKR